MKIKTKDKETGLKTVLSVKSNGEHLKLRIEQEVEFCYPGYTDAEIQQNSTQIKIKSKEDLIALRDLINEVLGEQNPSDSLTELEKLKQELANEKESHSKTRRTYNKLERDKYRKNKPKGYTFG